MNFNNKIRVTKENKKELESVIGDILFIDDIVYLEPSDFEYMQQVKELEKPDLLSYLYQETNKAVLIWDCYYGLNIDANLYSFPAEKIKELESDLENCLIGNYGDNN